MGSLLELQKALDVLDAGVDLLRTYEENSLHFEQLYNRAEIGDANSDDMEYYHTLFRHHQYLFLAKKFAFFWFDAERTERVFRRFRPDWKFFTPTDFEALVRCLLYLIEEKEYTLTQGSHDKGIDLCYKHVFRTQEGSTVEIRSVVQCKLYRGSVSVSDVRDFFGVMTTEIAEGYFFTTGRLTNAGIQFISKANESSYANRFRFVGREQFAALLNIGHRILESWEEFYNLDVNESDYELTSESILDKVTEAQRQAEKIIQMPVLTSIQPSLF